MLKRSPVVLLFYTYVSLFAISCNYSEHEKLKEKMKTIELGMSKNDVIQILGDPPSINEGKIDDVVLISLVYPPPRGSADSVFPTVIICKETELVVSVIIDESTANYNKRASSYELCKGTKEDSLQN